MITELYIRKAPGTWVVRTDDAILGETRNALELSRGDLPPMIFFPREDVAMAFLDPSANRSSRPLIGEGIHFTIHTPGSSLADAVWSCEAPDAGAERIVGYLTFSPITTTVEHV